MLAGRYKGRLRTSIVERAVRRTFQAAAIPGGARLEIVGATASGLRDTYVEELARRAGAARVFTNTLPDQIHNAALIASAVPNVRFVLVKRSREDVAWRTY